MSIEPIITLLNLAIQLNIKIYSKKLCRYNRNTVRKNSQRKKQTIEMFNR
jgi:hypothetical protein